MIGQLVYRADSQFITSVYRRPTFKGFFTNFESWFNMIFNNNLFNKRITTKYKKSTEAGLLPNYLRFIPTNYNLG